MKHFFSFSVRFLADRGYISRRGGAPQTAAALAMRTMYADPVNFLFVELLQSRVLDLGLWPEGEDWPSAGSEVKDEYCRQLLVILVSLSLTVYSNMCT